MAARHPDLSQAIWRKSSYSSSTGQNCVEVATNLRGIVAVRDSKDPDGPTLLLSIPEWRFFLSRQKAQLPRPVVDDGSLPCSVTIQRAISHIGCARPLR